MTGHGGYLQCVPQLSLSSSSPWLTAHLVSRTLTHGFTGYRFRTDRLYFDPILPPQFSQGYMLKGFKWQGGVYDIEVAKDNTKIKWKSGGSGQNVTVEIPKGNPKAGNQCVLKRLRRRTMLILSPQHFDARPVPHDPDSRYVGRTRRR